MKQIVFSFEFMGELLLFVMVGEGVFLVPEGANVHHFGDDLEVSLDIATRMARALGVDDLSVLFV